MTMKTFVAKTTAEKAMKFRRYCTRRDTTPYAVLSGYLESLVDGMVDDLTGPDDLVFDFSNLIESRTIFPNVESALLAHDLAHCHSYNELPGWFLLRVKGLLKQPEPEFDKLTATIDRISKNVSFLRLMIIKEVEESAKESDTKVIEQPVCCSELKPDQVKGPRITLTDEEADRLLAEIAGSL